MKKPDRLSERCLDNGRIKDGLQLGPDFFDLFLCHSKPAVDLVGRRREVVYPERADAQIRNFRFYTKTELAMTREFVDLAVENYFAIM